MAGYRIMLFDASISGRTVIGVIQSVLHNELRYPSNPLYSKHNVHKNPHSIVSIHYFHQLFMTFYAGHKNESHVEGRLTE